MRAVMTYLSSGDVTLGACGLAAQQSVLKWLFQEVTHNKYAVCAWPNQGEPSQRHP